MKQFIGLAVIGALLYGLWRWYRHEVIVEVEGTVHLQSEHEHFHLHVDLPSGIDIEPGDTVVIVQLPEVQGQTEGEISYQSPIRMHKASWLKRNLVKQSSLIEVSELVDHP